MLGNRGWYAPRWHYENEPETRQALDLVFENQVATCLVNPRAGREGE